MKTINGHEAVKFQKKADWNGRHGEVKYEKNNWAQGCKILI